MPLKPKDMENPILPDGWFTTRIFQRVQKTVSKNRQADEAMAMAVDCPAGRLRWLKQNDGPIPPVNIIDCAIYFIHAVGAVK